jgi:hypothetical protein
MYTSDVISHFGTVAAAAKALDISASAIYQWGDLVPKGTAYRLQVMTGGALQVRTDLYPKRIKDAAA